MEATRSDLIVRNEVEAWLKIILKNENIKYLSVNILGNSEKGDGYTGDIVFVSAVGATETGTEKTFELVLKCSKNSQALRAASPVEEIFRIEIFLYEVVLPYFIQFQKEKGVKNLFDSAIKCYGSITEEDKEVIVLENVKSIGYELWPKKYPLTRQHINLVVTEYGKFHATSVAVKHQRPAEFQEFVDSLGNVLEKFKETGDLQVLFGTPIDESYEMLKNDLDENVLAQWKKFKTQIDYVFGDMTNNESVLKVILHGDCWNNNFMFLYSKDDEKLPLKVKFLDWQVSRYESPIFDLSYFLFSCLSSEDFEKIDNILNLYHKTFVRHLEQLGIENSEALYPRNQFLDDWKNFSRYGVIMASLLMKIVSTEKDEVLDMVELAESGKPVSDTFLNEIKNKENYKKRVLPIIEYAVQHNLV